MCESAAVDCMRKAKPASFFCRSLTVLFDTLGSRIMSTAIVLLDVGAGSHSSRELTYIFLFPQIKANFAALVTNLVCCLAATYCAIE